MARTAAPPRPAPRSRTASSSPRRRAGSRGSRGSRESGRGRTRTAARRQPRPTASRRSPRTAAKVGRAVATGTRRLRAALHEQLGGHGLDIAAVALGVIAIIAALGVSTRAAGPLGDAIDTGVGAALGRGRYLLPIACLAAAAALVWRRDDREHSFGLRVGIGLGLVVAASVGLLHVAAGRPNSESLEVLRDAGGVLGALFGGSVAAVAGVIGGSVVLVALVAIGMLLVANLRVHQAGHALVVAMRWLGRQAGVLVRMALDPSLGAAYDNDAGRDENDEHDHDDDDHDEAVTGSSRRALNTRSVTGARRGARAVLYDQFAPVGEGADDEYLIDLVDETTVGGPAVPNAATDRPSTSPGTEAAAEPGVADGLIVDGPTPAQLSLSLPPGARASDWKLPAMNLLKKGSGRQVDQRFVDMGGEVLEATMREFGVDARLVGASVGPTVTRYELELAPGVKVNKVTGLAKEIAYAMASHDVRILAPIPGRSAIGVEVPNKQRPIITLGDILSSNEAKKAHHPLEVGMGRDIAGRAHMANLATFPHVLIAGQTGAGKSSCINSIVTSLLMRTTPDQVRLILVDPKRVELGQYNGVPHLLTEVVVNPKKAANALDWAVREMELRYDLLAEVGVRDITGYNAMFDRGDLPTAEHPDPVAGKHYERLPFIVIVVDELADLMMVAARDVETSICRLAQMARAVGLHLVIATQRPSVDVITGVIKANVPSRLAFAVSSLADSRVILDQPGAEKLVGKGDMLLLAASTSRTERIQGSWVDEDCVRKVVAHWRRQASAPMYVDGVQGSDDGSVGSAASGAGDDDSDDLLMEAMELVVRSGLGSTSMLQRKLRVGFARAGRLMDLLERGGVVGPSEGSKARAVLMTVDELEAVPRRS